jgi:hypothetical protein|tara:strand:- start:756 stop:1355 length:600 start_codon:yes stop_codon:yes gene_type:complete
MELNRARKKTAIQLMLLTAGFLLVIFIYFLNPANKKQEKILEDISDIKDTGSDIENKNIFENLEYRGVDKNKNEFVIFSEYSEFKTEEPSIINMKNVSCFFYFKDGTILEIRSKTGIYNNVTLDMSFEENVNMFYMDNSLVSDKADFSNENNNLIIEGNVTTQSQKGELMADKLNFDFSDKKLKASMYNEDRVNIKTSF